MTKLLYIFILFLLSFGLGTSYAEKKPAILIVPDCALNHKFHYTRLASSKNLHLIRTLKLNELQQADRDLPLFCRQFLNVSSQWEKDPLNQITPQHFLKTSLPKKRPSDFTHLYRISHVAETNQYLNHINRDLIANHLTTLMQFPDRYVNSYYGVQAAEWIMSVIQQMITNSQRSDLSLSLVPTMNAKQPSIILKVGQSQAPGILLGSHFDTLSQIKNELPEREENAAGAAILLEVARILLTTTHTFKKPIYLTWYAGQEEGKTGSQSVVQYVTENKIAIDSVLQVEMTKADPRKESGIRLVDDFTDSGLSAFVADLVAVYLKSPVNAVRCGYACSDHNIWYQAGFRVAYPFESLRRENRAIDFAYLLNVAKLALAFAIELGSSMGS